MTFWGENEHFSGKNGALRWSNLVGKQKHNVQKPISGVHCLPGLTVKSFPAAGHVATAFRTMIILRTL